MSKHRETKGNPLHGKNTLLAKVRETLSLGYLPVYHGSTCKACVHFATCEKHKGRIDNSDYCHHPTLGFRSAELLF